MNGMEDPRNDYLEWTGERAFDSSPSAVEQMDEADSLHAEMAGHLSGMGDEVVRRDPASSAIRRYMSGSVKVSVEWDGTIVENDCLEALTCHHGVTILYRADRDVGLPPDGAECTVSVGGASMKCRYTGLSWKSPGLGVCGAAFIFVKGAGNGR